MLHNPYKIVKMFEEEIAHYTGAPHAISIDSCTNALFLICKYLEVKEDYYYLLVLLKIRMMVIIKIKEIIEKIKYRFSLINFLISKNCMFLLQNIESLKDI